MPTRNYWWTFYCSVRGAFDVGSTPNVTMPPTLMEFRPTDPQARRCPNNQEHVMCGWAMVTLDAVIVCEHCRERPSNARHVGEGGKVTPICKTCAIESGALSP